MARFTPQEQDRLFRALADELLKRITAGACEHCGRSAATPQELQAVRQFLSDNDITAEAGANPALKGLVGKLPFPSKAADEAV